MKWLMLVMMVLSVRAQAVHENPEGLGEVLLLPYYAVNNNLNSLVTLTNHSDQGKALKINIREGHNGYAGMSLNVYLAPLDVWTFGVFPATSTEPLSFGDPTAQLYTTDLSCTSLSTTEPTEFDPAVLVDGSQSVARFTEGFIEILEMGVVSGDALADISHTADGWPSDCAAVNARWETGGVWHSPSGGNPAQDLGPPAGQLSAELTLIDVAQGVNFSLQATALADFYPDDGIYHVPPDDDNLSLDAAANTAWLMLDGAPVHLAFERGIDAVSGLLLKSRYYVNYDVNPEIKGRSELVISFPTRRFYLRDDALGLDPPFEPQQLGQVANETFYGMTGMGMILMSREADFELNQCGGVTGCQGRAPYDVAGSVAVVVIRESASQAPPQISGGRNYQINRDIPDHRFGARPGFEGVLYGDLYHDLNRPFTATRVDDNVVLRLYGLPAMGLMLQTYSNGNAQPGLLAQYGGIQAVRSMPLPVVELP